MKNHSEELTLRDQLAMAALPSMLALFQREREMRWKEKHIERPPIFRTNNQASDFEEVVQEAYAVADCALIVRNWKYRRPPGES